MVGKTFDRVLAIKEVATKTEKKLIEGLMKINGDELIYLSITELSAKLKVAEATIVRFCKKLGYNGFQDFKLSLSKELGIQEDTSNNSVVRKLALKMTDAIDETSRSIDYDECLQIADLLINARHMLRPFPSYQIRRLRSQQYSPRGSLRGRFGVYHSFHFIYHQRVVQRHLRKTRRGCVQPYFACGRCRCKQINLTGEY